MINGIMLHEAGHVVESAADKKLADQWAAAITADGNSVSFYGDSSHDEDFAESSALYVLRGKDEPAARVKFGHRFEILDRELRCGQ